MRVALFLPLCVCLAVSNLSAGVVEYSITSLTPHNYHYDYILNGLPFLANQELDIRFDPTVFGSISNATAGPGFFLVPCCQPNNPPGAFGDYAILALSDIASPSGKFGVDVFIPGSAVPGTQPFFFNQLDSDGNILFNLNAGFTAAAGPTQTPEPRSTELVGIGVILGLASWAARRIRRLTV